MRRSDQPQPPTAQGLLACISDPSRFRVLKELAREELCVTELAKRVELSQSCTTRHLQALGRVGAVLRRRAGKRVVFKIDPQPRLTQLMEWMQIEPRPSPAKKPAPGHRTSRPRGTSSKKDVESEVGAAKPPPTPSLMADPSAEAARQRLPLRNTDLEDFLL
jgi:DNA-binding transcriptional ArsR family regulator